MRESVCCLLYKISNPIHHDQIIFINYYYFYIFVHITNARTPDQLSFSVEFQFPLSHDVHNFQQLIGILLLLYLCVQTGELHAFMGEEVNLMNFN